MKLFRILAMMLVAATLIFTACDEVGEDNGAGLSAGDTETYTADGVSFVMAYVPGGYTFPTGGEDDGNATIANAYWIGETEVTYDLWQQVYTWATDAARGANIYNLANAGTQGDNGSRGIQHPVTTIDWRDSMVWCNALTEWYNAQKGTSYECVYTYLGAIIRDSRDSNETACDNAVASSTAKGFRLLASNEYELAARWRGDATNTVSGYTNPYFTKGNSASGATTYYNDNTGGSGEPGKSANDAVAVYRYYWDGAWIDNGTNSTAVVKSKGSGGANTLGLYDMSGNVWEWCFDLSGSFRVLRSGSYTDYANYLQVGNWNETDPYFEGPNIGFRLARTQ